MYDLRAIYLSYPLGPSLDVATASIRRLALGLDLIYPGNEWRYLHPHLVEKQLDWDDLQLLRKRLIEGEEPTDGAAFGPHHSGRVQPIQPVEEVWVGCPVDQHVAADVEIAEAAHTPVIQLSVHVIEQALNLAARASLPRTPVQDVADELFRSGRGVIACYLAGMTETLDSHALPVAKTGGGAAGPWAMRSRVDLATSRLMAAQAIIREAGLLPIATLRQRHVWSVLRAIIEGGFTYAQAGEVIGVSHQTAWKYATRAIGAVDGVLANMYRREAC